MLNTQKLNAIATNPWFLIVSGISSIAAFMWYVYDKYQVTPPSVTQAIVFSIALLIFIIGFIYSIQVRTENIALRESSKILYEINKIYQYNLHEEFFGSDPVTNPKTLLAREELVLKGICQRISGIFSRIINRNCMVTLKIVTKDDEDDKFYAHTYVRSQELCQRDSHGRIKFVVGTGENTGFDQAIAKRPDGLPSHFFSPDLRTHEGGYSNQRQHYDLYYRSTIVVPVRVNDENKGYDEMIGFLCVDTMSINRLNNSNHLFLLSALASQMYNFISLMRGRYIVLVG